jgi:hypothetical protein
MNFDDRPAGEARPDAIADEQMITGWSYDSRTDVLLLSGDQERETVALDVADGVVILHDAVTGTPVGLEISGLRKHLIEARNRERVRRAGSTIGARSTDREDGTPATTRSIVAQGLIHLALEVTGLSLAALET